MLYNYLRLEDKRTLYIDCDDTLIKWHSSEEEKNERGVAFGEGFIVVPHRANVDKVRQFKALGYIVVVWSQSGTTHAEKVVKLVGLGDYVDIIISKPTFFMDDIPAEKFMSESMRIWKEDKETIKTIQPTNSW